MLTQISFHVQPDFFGEAGKIVFENHCYSDGRGKEKKQEKRQGFFYEEYHREIGAEALVGDLAEKISRVSAGDAPEYHKKPGQILAVGPKNRIVGHFVEVRCGCISD